MHALYHSNGNMIAALCRNASRIIRTDFGRIVQEQQLLANPTCGLVPLLPTSLQQQVEMALGGIPDGKRLSWLQALVWCTDAYTWPCMDSFRLCTFCTCKLSSVVFIVIYQHWLLWQICLCKCAEVFALCLAIHAFMLQLN